MENRDVKGFERGFVIVLYLVNLMRRTLSTLAQHARAWTCLWYLASNNVPFLGVIVAPREKWVSMSAD